MENIRAKVHIIRPNTIGVMTEKLQGFIDGIISDPNFIELCDLKAIDRSGSHNLICVAIYKVGKSYKEVQVSDILGGE